MRYFAGAAVLALALLGSNAAYATDGYFSHGYGMKASGMGGAATAMADDAFGGANNPATMVFVGDRIDGGITWFRPDRHAQRAGSAGGTGALDASVDGNDTTNFLIPEFGYNHMMRPDLSLGVTVYGNGGMNTDYPGGQLDQGICGGGAPNGVKVNMLCGPGNLGVDLSQLIIAPTIVRGNTSKEIVQMAREAGARKVYMASAAPPVRFPNVYGIDMPTREELIAADRSVEEIREFIGADALIYQDVDAMKRVVGALNPKVASFEASCFDGHYITGDVSDSDFATLEAQRRLQFDDEDGNGRGRLALQSTEEGA